VERDALGGTPAIGGDFARAFAFMRRGDMRGTDERPFRFGTAIFTPELPDRQDSNLLYLDRLDGDVTADAVRTESERLFRAAGRRSQVLVFPDAGLAERLLPAFDGWQVHRSVVMVKRRPVETDADTASVVEVGDAAVRPARRSQILSYPWGTSDLATQLLDAKMLLRRWQSVRCFARFEDGQVASYADLYASGKDAQVEDVATLPQYRERGFAKAVVARAVDEAHAAGAEFVFLVAMEDDWPKELYRRLGFDVVGRYVKVFKGVASTTNDQRRDDGLA
jgi:ribosomal protein S18 acetylase RimI-like enzyme